ncbi:MAG: hypothetical protein SWH78_11340 [Thermodesulfobacteriota bacterium]|nr:hypothetical protein [Thermodesulfobacteriota bacterium]
MDRENGPVRTVPPRVIAKGRAKLCRRRYFRDASKSELRKINIIRPGILVTFDAPDGDIRHHPVEAVHSWPSGWRIRVEQRIIKPIYGERLLANNSRVIVSYQIKGEAIQRWTATKCHLPIIVFIHLMCADRQLLAIEAISNPERVQSESEIDSTNIHTRAIYW